MNKNKEFGGVALEYLLVTIFATLMTAILFSVVANLTQQKIRDIADKFDLEIGEIEINPFNKN